MSEPLGDNELLLESMIPWELVAEFWTLAEILTARLVSTAWLEAIEHLSPEICAQLLSQKLRRDNIYLFHDTAHWRNASNDQDMVTDVLLTRNATTTAANHPSTAAAEPAGISPFSSMLHSYRVCKYFPNEVVVAFNGKYGRHVLPTILTAGRPTSEAVLYEKCNRRGCTTCKFRLPVAPTFTGKQERGARQQNRRRVSMGDSSEEDEDDESGHGNSSNVMDIDAHFTIEDEQDDKLDLKQYYHSCVANLPSDLACPVCRSSNSERTLLLSEFSYRCVPGGDVRHPCQVRLTFTPDDDFEDGDGDHDDDDDSSDGLRQVPSSKRKRRDSDTNNNDGTDDAAPPFPPPMYQDMGIPTETRPLLHKPDAKHVICIHCVKCQKFGILAPAAPCMHPEFPCQKRGVLEMIGSPNKKYPTKLGGCFVRTKCSAEDCYKPTLCQQCARLHFHPTYESGDSIRWTSHCPRCRTTFCQEHAWYSTSCCHI